MPVVKERLRSDPFPELKFMTVVRVTIGPNGGIHQKPKKFYASQRGGDLVTWAFTNNSGGPLTVSVIDFLRRPDCSDDEGTVPVNPFVWLPADTVQLADRATGYIDGRVDPNYPRQNANSDDCLSYSIRVVAGPLQIDYDPDGDIKP